MAGRPGQLGRSTTIRSLRATSRAVLRGWSLALLLAWAPAGGADPASHRAAARAFYEVARSRDPEAMAGAIAEMIGRVAPGLAAQRAVIGAFARDLVTSQAFAEATVNAYMELFSEADLRALAELFASPVYQRYRARRLDLVRRSTERILELVRSRLPELEQQMRAAGESER